MTREETIALWAQSDEARAAAIAEGKTQEEADEASALIWNSWAREVIGAQAQLKQFGAWAAGRGEWGVLEPQNEQTYAWRTRAWADFSGLTFKPYQQGSELTKRDTPLHLISVKNRNAGFRKFIFPAGVSFENSNFNVVADFRGAQFQGEAIFECSIFEKPARFVSARFLLGANLAFAEFRDWADFFGATFDERTRFSGASFDIVADFTNCLFPSERQVSFRRAKFKQAAFFTNAHFRGGLPDFRGASADHTFDITDTTFVSAPWFNQANFSEAPDLDRLRYPIPSFLHFGTASLQRWFTKQKRMLPSNKQHRFPNKGSTPFAVSEEEFESGLKRLPQASCYRAIRRLAIQGHDHENEAKAFKGEVRSKRGTIDKPWHASFWFGALYDVLSDFGKSLLRPFLAWALCIVIFAAYFLGQNPDMAAERQKLDQHGFMGQVAAYSVTAWDAAFRKPAPACFDRAEVDANQNGFSGLVEQVRNKTNLVSEAFSIAYHNALVILDNNGDSAHRAFGCLYGVERYGGNPVAFVPRSVAIASALQKVLSAIFIFLFGLALRNMLKVK